MIRITVAIVIMITITPNSATAEFRLREGERSNRAGSFKACRDSYQGNALFELLFETNIPSTNRASLPFQEAEADMAFEKFSGMTWLLLSLSRMFHPALTLVDHRVLIEEFTRKASKGTFALLPIGCDSPSYSATPASVISRAVLSKPRYPRRIVVIVCHSRTRVLHSLWKDFSARLIREYWPQYITLIDLTTHGSPPAFTTGDLFLEVPFSYVLYKIDGDHFELHVDSDFNGARRAWDSIKDSRKEVARDESIRRTCWSSMDPSTTVHWEWYFTKTSSRKYTQEQTIRSLGNP